tara:strand:+ start:2415 stop:2738 length:324 start_codon:yes stop_codon:yes gene_type:complete
MYILTPIIEKLPVIPHKEKSVLVELWEEASDVFLDFAEITLLDIPPHAVKSITIYNPAYYKRTSMPAIGHLAINSDSKDLIKRMKSWGHVNDINVTLRMDDPTLGSV